MFSKPRHIIRITLLFLFVLFSVTSDTGAKYSVSARSVIFSDSTAVKRLYGKKVHKQVLPASTTKVMTALLVLERLPLDKYVTVSHRATKVEPTKLWLKPGDKYRVRDLLYAILLKSANDAAVVLAEAVSGSEKEFVKLMNKRAKQIGANHTKFANPHGLPSKSTQYTTAYDMYLIFRIAIRNSFFKKAISYKYKTIYSKNGRKHTLKTHNKSLFKGWKQNLYGKTGYTHAAKSCFVGYTTKKGNILIMAIFGCSRRWQDVKYIVEKYGRIDL